MRTLYLLLINELGETQERFAAANNSSIYSLPIAVTNRRLLMRYFELVETGNLSSKLKLVSTQLPLIERGGLGVFGSSSVKKCSELLIP